MIKLYIIAGVILYALIGGILGGIVGDEDDEVFTFIIMTFWPAVILLLLVRALIILPFKLGKFIKKKLHIRDIW